MRILYLSYFYPPLGGPASLRNVKTVKYLAEAGISCDVITPAEIEYLHRDASLLAECREERVIRTASLDPMALLKKLKKPGGEEVSQVYLNTPERLKLLVRRLYPLDNKIGWLPFLVDAGKKAARERDYDLVYVSLGPFSSALGAWFIAKDTGLPYAVDLRDYWTLLADYDLQGSALNRKISRHWEGKIYREAKLIVTATKGIGTDAAAAFGSGLAEKMITVYNGWDEADFCALPPVAAQGGFSFAYFGSLYARRSLKHFYAALARLKAEGGLPEGAKVKLYGNYFRETLDEIAASGIAELVEILPPLDHRQALAAMRGSDVLLLPINSSSPRGTLTSKVFEYLRAQRPILAMVPAHNEAAELLRACGHPHICAMESTDSIHHCLKRLLADREREYAVPWGLEREKQVAGLGERLRSDFLHGGTEK